jgi:FtsH-binding integral membrane protein
MTTAGRYIHLKCFNGVYCQMSFPISGVRAASGVVVRTGVERATLIRRTYSLVFASILVTMGGVAVGLTQPAIMSAVAAHPIISLICVFAPLMLAMSRRDVFPINIGLVFLFTFAEGVVLSPLFYVYGRTMPGVLEQAGLLTVTTFAVLTLYAFVSRRDFSAWGGFLTVGLWVLFATLLLNMFFHNPAAQLWLSAVGLLLFSGFLIFDTWRIRNVYGPDDYVIAAVSIYLDLLNIFLFLLQLLGGDRRR